MADKIEVNYEQMEQIASRFSGQSQTVQETHQKVHNSMSKLENGGWEGRGSNAFFAEMHGEVLPAVHRLLSALNEASRICKQISQTMHNAEEEAASPFRST